VTMPPMTRPGHRRRGTLVAAAVVLAVALIAGGVVAAVALMSGDGGRAPVYARRDKVCDLVDVAPLAALSLAERAGAGRTTARGADGGDGDDPYVRCEIQVSPAATESGYDLRATVDFYPDASAATDGYVDEQERLDSMAGSSRSDASGVGRAAFFGTDLLYGESDGDRYTMTTFHVIARDRNVVVSVGLGLVRDPDWNQAAVRDALIPIARTILTGLDS
jgi:hypothetical protein